MNIKTAQHRHQWTSAGAAHSSNPAKNAEQAADSGSGGFSRQVLLLPPVMPVRWAAYAKFNEQREIYTMTRPKLNRHITPDDFLSFYWLKEELISFLQEHDLSTTGSKQDLTVRISQFLATGIPENKPSQKLARRAETMPKTFTRQSVIGSGWRCSQELRSFFEQEIGAHFHFDGVMRDFIHNGVGKTLYEAIETWKEEQRKPVQEKSIASQFEYNRHIREYFKTHPGAKLPEAIQDWKIKKKERRNVSKI